MVDIKVCYEEKGVLQSKSVKNVKRIVIHKRRETIIETEYA